MEKESDEQVILENIRVFLEKRKQCSNIEPEVSIALSEAPIAGWPTSLTDCGGKAIIDFVGGRIYEDEDKYPRIDLHCIEYKSANDDVIRGIGQLFRYKFLIHESYTWVDHLFVYLMVDERKTTGEILRNFLRQFGFGLLELSEESRVVSEILPSEDQSGIVRRTALKDIQIHCSKDYSHKVRWEELKNFQCPHCESSLERRAWISKFADSTQGSSRNTIYQGAPDRIPDAIRQNLLLAKVFRNWDLVKKNWKPA